MTAQTTIRSLAAAQGWTASIDTATALQLRKGEELIDLTFTKAGVVNYGALFVVGEDSYQVDHVDGSTAARRARVLSWVAYSDVRAAARQAV